MSKSLQDADREARKLVANWTTGAALTGWIPGSAFFLTAADTAMIHQVASAYGISAFDMNNLLSVLGGAVASAIAGGVITEVVGIIPIVGWAVKSAAMAAKAKVIGDEVIRYFRERSDLPDTKVVIDVEIDDD
ncbi:MAG: hypothetical protein OXT68_13405 [Chloroflexota bacterium]|nr:hypothetical protein [Chloroflexota bacterium]MDE2951746.1 hypothetical protein [Chloroflexota bacterium]